PAVASRQCAVGTAIATTLNEVGNVPIAKASVFVFGASGTVPTLNNTLPGLLGAVTVTAYDAAGTTADAVSPFENAGVIGTLPFAYTPTVGATARWRTVTRLCPAVGRTSLLNTPSFGAPALPEASAVT